jgi:hypothetical protein
VLKASFTHFEIMGRQAYQLAVAAAVDEMIELVLASPGDRAAAKAGLLRGGKDLRGMELSKTI